VIQLSERYDRFNILLFCMELRNV